VNQNKLPDIIYHYTSLDAFFSITQNENIRLMSHLSTNDSAEFLNNADFITHYLSSLADSDRFYSWSEEFLNYKQSSDLFLASFSLNALLQTQWKSYANDFLGVAIGIDLELAKVSLQTDVQRMGGITLAPGKSYSLQDQYIYGSMVKYEEEAEFKANIHELYTKYFPNGIQENIEDPASLLPRNFFIREMINNFVSRKRKEFEHEKEFRIVAVADETNKKLFSEKKFLVRNEKLVSFLEFPLKLECIKEVFISSNFKDKIGLESYLEAIGLSKDIIQVYETTYKPK
jgi:hypothetical protein